MADINDDIAVYEGMRQELEANHTGEWVIVHDRKFVSIHPTFEAAAEEAVNKFGRGPYLIRQVGAPPVVLPASLMYHLLTQ